jgi:type IV secretory pathway VirB10-like protein
MDEDEAPPPLLAASQSQTKGRGRFKIIAAGIAGVVVTGAIVVALVFVFGDKGANASTTPVVKRGVTKAAPNPQPAAGKQPPPKTPLAAANAKAEPPAPKSKAAKSKPAAPKPGKQQNAAVAAIGTTAPEPETAVATRITPAAAQGDADFVEKDGGWGWWEKCDDRYNMRKLPQALHACEQGLKAAKNKKIKAALLFTMGRICEKAKDYDGARTFYAKSLKVHPDNKAAKRKLALLKKQKYNK